MAVPVEDGSGEQRHCRTDMSPMHRKVHDDEVILGHHAMDRCRRAVEVVVERREGLSKAFAALWPRRVLDEVLGDETEGRVVSELHGLVKGEDSLCGRHRDITYEAGGVCESMSGGRNRREPTPGLCWSLSVLRQAGHAPST